MARQFFIKNVKFTTDDYLKSNCNSGDLLVAGSYFSADVGYTGVPSGTLTVTVIFTNGEGLQHIWSTHTDQVQTSLNVEIPYTLRETSEDSASTASIRAEVHAALSLYDVAVENVAQLCENVSNARFCITNFVCRTNNYTGYLKAFCSFNDPRVRNKTPYALWEVSYDGIHFQPAPHKTFPLENGVWVKTLPTLLSEDGSIDNSIQTSDSKNYVAKQFFPLTGVSARDSISDRYDVFPVPVSGNSGLKAITYSFKIVYLKSISTSSYNDSEGVSRGCSFEEDRTLGFSQFNTLLSDSDEFVEFDLGNASLGIPLYHNTVLFTYGEPTFANNIMASYAGEFTRPLSNIIDLAAQEDTLVTNITPWRDYLTAFTENAVYLITKASDGYLTKTINTSIGIPKEDWRCCKAVLNGIIFKSGSKVYMLYPNMYSGDETVLNITDLSKPVEDYIVEYSENASTVPFALSTEEAYFLFMPNEKTYTTSCLKYSYNNKLWTAYEYPALFVDFEMFSVNDIRVFAKIQTDAGITYAEYSIEKDIEELFDNVAENLPYGDFLTESTEGIAADIASWTTVSETQPLPIHFVIDSGQKTDSLGYTKQFVETKLVVSTEHEKDTFPVKVTVHVDGDSRIHTVDVNTDSAFWKSETSHVGTLGAGPLLSSGGMPLHTFRQMFLRYSGKGKSVRHIVEGTSVYKFKFYGIYIRYRNLNVKQ